MASQIISYRVDESTVVGFEVESGAEWNPAGAREVAGRVQEAVAPAVEAAKIVLEKVKAARPDEVKVKFGVKVTGEANWIVARAATDCNFEITLTWSPSSDGDAAPAAAE